MRYNGINSDVLLFKDQEKYPNIIRISSFTDIYNTSQIDEIVRPDNTKTKIFDVIDDVYSLSKDENSNIVFNRINKFLIHENLKFLKKITYRSTNKYKFKPFVCTNKFSLVLYNNINNNIFNGNIYHLNNDKEKNNSLIQFLNIEELNKIKEQDSYSLNFGFGYLIGCWLIYGHEIKFNNEYKSCISIPKEKNIPYIRTLVNNYSSFIKENDDSIDYIILDEDLKNWLNNNFIFNPKQKNNNQIFQFNKTIPDWFLISDMYFIEGLFSSIYYCIGHIETFKQEKNILIKTKSKHLANRITTLIKLRFGLFYYINKISENNITSYNIYFDINNSIYETLKYAAYLKAISNNIDENLIKHDEYNYTNFNIITSERLNIHNINEESSAFNFNMEKNNNFINIDGLVINGN